MRAALGCGKLGCACFGLALGGEPRFCRCLRLLLCQQTLRRCGIRARRFFTPPRDLFRRGLLLGCALTRLRLGFNLGFAALLRFGFDLRQLSLCPRGLRQRARFVLRKRGVRRCGCLVRRKRIPRPALLFPFSKRPPDLGPIPFILGEARLRRSFLGAERAGWRRRPGFVRWAGSRIRSAGTSLAQIAALALGILQVIEQTAHVAPDARPARYSTRLAPVMTSSTSGIGFTMGRNADRKR